MTQAGDELEPEVLSYSAFLNRQLLKAWRERMRVHERSTDKNQMVGHSLRLSRLWGATIRQARSVSAIPAPLRADKRPKRP